MRALVVGFLGICLIITGCSDRWDTSIHKTKIHPIERYAIQYIYNNWNYDYITRHIINQIKARSAAPELPFDDMKDLLKTINRRMISHKLACENDASSVCTSDHVLFSDILTPEDYERIFDERIGTVAQPTSEEEVYDQLSDSDQNKQNETVYLRLDRIEKLIESSKGCQGATDMLRGFLRDRNYLTPQDEEEVWREITYCKTVELMNQVK